MKYYKIDFKSIFLETEQEVLGHANGEFVPNGKHYFDRMGKGEIIKDAPVFDYFYLQSFGEKKDWEWRLQDVHGFMGVGSIIIGWYISDQCKQLFERFAIAKAYYFYPTKLLYKGEKLDYWIFQYAADDKGISYKSYVDYQKSEFFDEKEDIFIKISDYNEFRTVRTRIGKETDYEKDLITRKTVLNQAVDFIPFFGISSNRVVVSERLKKAIEDNGLEGFEFSDLDYEVIVASDK